MAAGSPCAQAAFYLPSGGLSTGVRPLPSPVARSGRPLGLRGAQHMGLSTSAWERLGLSRCAGGGQGVAIQKLLGAYPGHVAHAARTPRVSNHLLSHPAVCGRGPPPAPTWARPIVICPSFKSPRDSGVTSLSLLRRLQVSFSRESSRCPVPRTRDRGASGPHGQWPSALWLVWTPSNPVSVTTVRRGHLPCDPEAGLCYH